ncbi:MAG: hypothetical protein P8R37_06370 [Opitutae bacterium]|nr:hypothetical protein [Opitutae bacterium]MDG1301197.1 hypothetical protein [Opitutae bacterium]
MKFIKLLAFLGITFFLTACASTDEAASASAGKSAEHSIPAADMAGSHDAHNEGLLMDQYKSGEIPGYRD